MKKLLIFLLVAAVSAVSYAEGEYTNYNEKNQTLQCFDAKGKPLPSGTIYETLEDGSLETPCKNGKAEGVVKEYYKSGKIRSETPYKWFREGTAKMYYEGGGLYKETSYKKAKRDGDYAVYREDGELAVTVTYQNDKAVKGVCRTTNGDDTPLTTAEIANLNKGLGVECP